MWPRINNIRRVGCLCWHPMHILVHSNRVISHVSLLFTFHLIGNAGLVDCARRKTPFSTESLSYSRPVDTWFLPAKFAHRVVFLLATARVDKGVRTWKTGARSNLGLMNEAPWKDSTPHKHILAGVAILKVHVLLFKIVGHLLLLLRLGDTGCLVK